MMILLAAIAYPLSFFPVVIVGSWLVHYGVIPASFFKQTTRLIYLPLLVIVGVSPFGRSVSVWLNSIMNPLLPD